MDKTEHLLARYKTRRKGRLPQNWDCGNINLWDVFFEDSFKQNEYFHTEYEAHTGELLVNEATYQNILAGILSSDLVEYVLDYTCICNFDTSTCFWCLGSHPVNNTIYMACVQQKIFKVVIEHLLFMLCDQRDLSIHLDKVICCILPEEKKLVVHLDNMDNMDLQENITWNEIEDQYEGWQLIAISSGLNRILIDSLFDALIFDFNHISGCSYQGLILAVNRYNHSFVQGLYIHHYWGRVPHTKGMPSHHLF